MNARTFHLLWGVVLYSLYIILSTMQMPLMRLSAALSPPQTLALIALSEAITLLPFTGVIKKKWAISKPKEWIAFSFLSFLLASNFLIMILCSQHMSLGDFSALDTGSTMVFVPLLTLTMYRRCINVEDGFGILAALIGVVLVTQPQFLFGSNMEETRTPAFTYILAISAGFPNALICFVIGYFPHVHWTSYNIMRTLLTTTVALLALSMTAHWNTSLHTFANHTQNQHPQKHWQQSSSTSSPPLTLWISLLAALTIGLMANIYRAACVYACQELELYGEGTAGIVGNIINSSYIAVSAIYAFLFFEETMTTKAIIGALIISIAIIVVTAVRVARAKKTEMEGKDKGKLVQQGEDDGEKIKLLQEVVRDHEKK